MQRLRDVMLDAPDDFDPGRRPPDFDEARHRVRAALADAEGIPDPTLAAALLSEAVPRLVGAYGPGHAARILAMFAACLQAGDPFRQ